MENNYRSEMYKVSFMPQWKLAGQECGYSKLISEGGSIVYAAVETCWTRMRLQ